MEVLFLKTKDIVIVSIFAALNVILELFETAIPFRLPQGGRLGLAFIPIILCGLLFGWKKGVMAGIIAVLLQTVLGLATTIVHPAQYLLDYFLAISVMGLAGTIKPMPLGIIFVHGLRFCFHVLSGVIFFGEYAGTQNVWIYSIVYNASHVIPSIVVSLIFVTILYQRFKDRV